MAPLIPRNNTRRFYCFYSLSFLIRSFTRHSVAHKTELACQQAKDSPFILFVQIRPIYSSLATFSSLYPACTRCCGTVCSYDNPQLHAEGFSFFVWPLGNIVISVNLSRLGAGN